MEFRAFGVCPFKIFTLYGKGLYRLEVAQFTYRFDIVLVRKRRAWWRVLTCGGAREHARGVAGHLEALHAT